MKFRSTAVGAAAVADPADPTELNPAYNSGDFLLGCGQAASEASCGSSSSTSRPSDRPAVTVRRRRAR